MPLDTKTGSFKRVDEIYDILCIQILNWNSNFFRSNFCHAIGSTPSGVSRILAFSAV